MQLLEKIPGVSFVVPHGAFYLFPDVGALFKKLYRGQRVEDVDALAEMLLEHAHIAVVPGSAFGSPSHIRISYAIPLDDITTGLKSFDAFVRALA
jgi:aspartate aminotransferase